MQAIYKVHEICLPESRVFLISPNCSYNNMVNTPSKVNKLIIKTTAIIFMREHRSHTLVLGCTL